MRQLLLMIAAVLVCVAARAAPHEVHDLQREMAALKEVTAAQIQAARADSAREQALLNERQGKTDKTVEMFDKRVGDIDRSIAYWTFITTLLVAAIGVITYFNAGSKARAETREWLDKHRDDITSDARKDIAAATSDAIDRIKGALDDIDALRQQALKHGLDIQATLDRAKQNADAFQAPKAQAPADSGIGGADEAGAPAATALDAEQSRVLKQENQSIAAKPESEYSAEDWRTRGLAAHASSDHEGAAYFFKRAVDAAQTDAERARSTISRAIALEVSGRAPDAMALVESVIAARDHLPQATVAKAMFGKAHFLFNAARLPEAVAVVDELVRAFGDSTDVEVQREVAGAMGRRAYALLDAPDSAGVDVYRAVIERWATSGDEKIAVIVARATFNSAAWLHAADRRSDAIGVYQELWTRFASSNEPEVQRLVAEGLYFWVSALEHLGRKEHAKHVLAQGLTRFVGSSDPEVRRWLDATATLLQPGTTP